MRGQAVRPVPDPWARASCPSLGGRSVTWAAGTTLPGSLGGRQSERSCNLEEAGVGLAGGRRGAELFE